MESTTPRTALVQFEVSDVIFAVAAKFAAERGIGIIQLFEVLLREEYQRKTGLLPDSGLSEEPRLDLEIDGINFSRYEVLTSEDRKFGKVR